MSPSDPVTSFWFDQKSAIINPLHQDLPHSHHEEGDMAEQWELCKLNGQNNESSYFYCGGSFEKFDVVDFVKLKGEDHLLSGTDPFNQAIALLLADGWEPFQWDQGTLSLRRKDNS
jgi:hypothetical protein